MIKRKPYRRGVKRYLASFEVGETRTCDESLVYASVKQIASRMKRDYGCVYTFDGKTITRLQ